MAEDKTEQDGDTARVLQRRQALKRVGEIVAAAAVGLTAGGGIPATASTKSARKTRVLTKIALEGVTPSGSKTVVSLADGVAGGLTFQGRSFSFIPQLSKGGKRVELAIYQGTRAVGRPLQTLDIGLTYPMQAGQGVHVPVSLESLPFKGFAAFWAGATEVPADYAPFADCTVTCTCSNWTATACAVCCEVGRPECGTCCEPPCCPADCGPPGE